MRTPGVRCAWIAVLAGLSLVACEEEKPMPTFRVTFHGAADGDELAGVRVIADGQMVGETDENGVLTAQLRGREGQAVAVNAQCPEGHRPPEQLPLLTLRSFQGLDPAVEQRGVEMTISCPPSERLAAVVVRAGGQADLPVLLRGQELARTDAAGVAHVLLKMRPNTSFRLELDTSSNEDLRPQNPGAVFTVPDANEIFLFDQPFEVEERRRRVRYRPRPAAPSPMRPIRLN